MTATTRIILAIVMFGFLTFHSLAATWYVATNGTGTGTGGWEDATNSISGTITASSPDDTIIVSNGTWVGRYTIGKKLVFRAHSTNPADTVIDGNGSTVGAVLTITNAEALVSGFTISNGGARGVYINRDGGTLSNCVVVGNSRFATSGSGGAGILMTPTGTGLVVDSTICGNVCTGIQTAGAGVNMSNGELLRCVISNNVATNRPGVTMYGGGIYVATKGKITSCEIVNNSCLNVASQAGYGGGIFSQTITSDIVISQCVIRANTAGGGNGSAGGGICLNGRNVLYGSTIEENMAGLEPGTTIQGGGVWVANTNSVIQNCLIRGNTSWRHGGGIYLTSVTKGSMFLRNCLVYGNSAAGTGSGGGIYLADSMGDEAYIASCTIVSNIAAENGGGLYLARSTNYVYNSIIASNRAASGWQVYNSAAHATNYYFNTCVPAVNLPVENGNIKVAPGFIDFYAGDFRLAQDSPCINTGTNQDWTETAFDLDGYPRLDRFSRKIDMGAYEYIPPGILFFGR